MNKNQKQQKNEKQKGGEELAKKGVLSNKAFSYNPGSMKAFSYFTKNEKERAFSYNQGNRKAFSYPIKNEKEEAFFYVEEEESNYLASNLFLKKTDNGDVVEEKNKLNPKKIVENAVASSEKLGNFELILIGVKKEIWEGVEGEKFKNSYRFRIKLLGDEIEKSVGVSELYSFGWVHMATDGRAFVDEEKGGMTFKRYVHKIIELNYNSVPHEIYYRQNGWKKIEKKIVYVCDRGIVGESSRGKIWGGSEFKFEVDEQNIGTKKNFEQFYEMQKICKNKKISRTLMIFTSLSVMTTLFQWSGYPVKFILGVLGTTNTMKTSSTLVFTKIFNSCSSHSPELTFSSTMGGIESKVSSYADAVLMVDDFKPAENKRKQAEMNDKLELLCRLYGDRASKKRMTDFLGKQIEYPVRGCCVFTGEILTGVESSKTRILTLNLKKGDIQKGYLSYYQQNPLILSTYLYGFIMYLQKNIKLVLGGIQESVSYYRAKANYSVARLNETQAILFTALDISESYWKSSGFISKEDSRGEEWKKDIADIILENDKQMVKCGAVEVILCALEEKYYCVPQILKPIEEISRQNYGLAYYDENFIYVQLEDLYRWTKEYCAKYDVNFYLQKSMIAEKLKEKNVVECVTNSKKQEECARKLKQGKGNTRRYLYLKRKRIEELLNQGEVEE